MINDARSYASLSSGLLARKGAAKPAMRPQGFGHHAGFDDLGWNDMGSQNEAAPEDGFEGDPPEHVPSSIAALTPAPRHPKSAAEPPEPPVEPVEPEVIAQQRAIAESFPPEVEVEAEAEAEAEAEVAPPAAVVPLPKRVPAAAAPAVAPGRKAAFTLRLDAERHLRLRLATAVTGRSAQQIVTGALDAILASIPEIEALAERVPAAKAKRN
jgi:hypothetical protein